ncbi:MAG: methionyl-tRNA formyltransferase [Spirochaetales bacterium]
MLKILYAGSPDVSAGVLTDLINSKKVTIVAVLTNAPSAKGRHKTPQQTPVAQVAVNAGIPVLEPERITEDVRNRIAEYQPDILVCFAYGKIFGPKCMSLFPLGGINLHTSLLPKFRGASPVCAAILAGEKETGVTVQRIAPEMDTGDILLQHRLTLSGTENSQEILFKLAESGGNMLNEVLNNIENGTEIAIKQNESDATYCAVLKKEDGIIDWEKTADEICTLVRAVYSWPGAFTSIDNTLLTLHKASVFDKADSLFNEKNAPPGTLLGTDKESGILFQTGKGILAVQILQKHGKKTMQWKDFANGMHNLVGMCCINPKKTS